MLLSLKKGLALAVMASMATALGAGCTGSKPTTSNETGAARVSVRSSALTADIASVKLTISGGTPALSAPIVVALASNGKQDKDAQYTGLVSGIPAGTGRVFKADAYKADGTTVAYSGQAAADIAAGSTALVYILAQEQNAGQAVTVFVPVVDSLTASDSTVAPSATMNVAVAAHSPYTPADALTFLWSAACAPGSDNGTFANAASAATSWSAPATNSSSCVLSVAIQDQHSDKVTAYLIVNVQAASNGNAGTTVYANTWPVVTSAFADVKYDQAAGTPPVAGTTTEADLTVQAHDPDGDNLAYSWSDGNCGGVFSAPTAAQTHYSVADSKSCTLTVTVSDLCTGGDCAGAKDTNGVALTDGSQRGGHISALFNIAAKASFAQSPVITLTMQPNADGVVAAGSSYALRVDATDPQSQALTFAWSATAGALTGTNPFTAASPASSLVTWQAPASLVSVMDVTVSIADGTAAPAKAYTFHFHSSDPCVSLADGAGCTLNACIQGSTCLSHACQGGTAKVAPALTACQASAVCDPNTGSFTVSNKVDGTGCSTGSLCQTGEVCAAGVCGGGAAVVCTQPANTCTAVGACVPATGCPTPAPVAAGKACTGADKCMQTNLCDGDGACVGSNPVTCNASTNPCVANGVCQPTTGLCVGNNVADGTGCSTDVCETGMTCSAGQCGGGSPKCGTGTTCNAGTCIAAPPVTPVVVRDVRVQQNGGMATDATGATYLASALTNLTPISFDGFNLATTGDTDFFFAKYDTTGKAVWAVGIGDSDGSATPQYATGAAVSQNGALAYIGRYSGHLQFGTPIEPDPTDPTTWTYPAGDLSSATETDMLGGVSTVDGSTLWGITYNTGTNGKLLSIAANPSSTANRVAVCGKADTIGVTKIQTGVPAKGYGQTDVIIAVYNGTLDSTKALAKAWGKQLNGASSDECDVVQVDDAGDVYAGGWYYSASLALGNDASGNPVTLTGTGTTANKYMWVAKFRGTDGAVLAAKSFVAVGDLVPLAMSTDAAGELVIGGKFTGGVTFGSTVLPTAGADDIFVVKVDPASAFAPLWAVSLGGPDVDQVGGVAVSSTGDVLVTGAIKYTTSGAAVLTAAGSYGAPDAFLLRLNGKTGATLAAAAYGDPSTQTGDQLTVNRYGSNQVAMIGSFNTNITFPPLAAVNATDGKDTFLMMGTLP